MRADLPERQPRATMIGVVTFLIARDVIGALTNAWMLYFGLLFVALVLFRPEGIAGIFKSVLERRTMRTRGATMLRLLFRSG